MSIFNYHRRLLSPTVWKTDELRPSPRVRNQIRNQIQARFPAASRVFLAGDLAGHYYDEVSPLDLIVYAPKEKVAQYKQEAQVVNGYLLSGTDHGVYFHILSNTIKPELLAEKFGPIFDIEMNRWFGKRVTGNTELIRPDAILQRIKWRLYKVKDYDDELYPYEWIVLSEAVRHLSTEGRQNLKDSLREVIARLKHNVGNVLASYTDAAVWRSASALQELIDEDSYADDIQEFVEANSIPSPVVLAMINVLRYQDVLAEIEEVDEQIKELDEIQSQGRGVQLQSIASTKRTSSRRKQAAKAASEFVWQRLANLVDLVIIQNGGYGNAVETVFQLVSRVLDKSRYMNTGIRRRKVALRLYQKYYRHMKDV
jgi:hypothetical protein